MPIYAYRCESCGHAKDVLQKVSDPLLTQCPACGAGTFKKQLTAAGFQLKGSGWYATDFRGNSGGAAKANGAGETNSANGSGDSKPAETKSEPAAPSSAPAAASGGSAASSGGCGSSCACH